MSSDDTSLVGKEFGNYRLAEVLGRGGTSVVYRAVHKSIGSEVAIKILRRSGSPAMVQRFFNEAVAASQIRHPGIATVFDYDLAEDGVVYLVMELLQGENLGDRLRRRGRLDPLEAARLMRQVCNALVAAHEADIVHRDIKPQNLFVVRDAEVVGGERVKVLDFGVAKLLAAEAEPAGASDRKLLLGTPLYMAPEQFRGGQNGDPRTDVYQVGAVLYHLIIGRPPFPDVRERMRSAAVDAPEVRPPLDGIMPGMDAVILRCLHRDPDRRYPDMRALEDDLRGCLWEPTTASDQSPTIVHRIPDLSESRKPAARPVTQPAVKLPGAHTLASASVASGFFRAADLGSSRMFKESGEFFQQVRQTFEFYRKHLDDEYRQLSAQIDSAHRLWIACVGVGFAILMAGLIAVLLGQLAQGVLTASASTVMYFIVRVFQKREDYYREEKSLKIKYLQYGNDWLLLIQSIEAIPDAGERLEEQHRLAQVLLDRIQGQHGLVRPRDPASAPPRKSDRRARGPRKSAPVPTPTPPPP
ncbi:MAG TPA: serine/threonine-protein kinase [Kofleriaceae bacterium]|jgi:serine/threonine protein kinase|nr:serine/threonine-protein kinase [Kofleriaceae bacterium]